MGQLIVAGFLAWTFWQSARRAQALIASEGEHSQALLERLSIATQAAGIYCWELDWKTYAITWDESRLPAGRGCLEAPFRRGTRQRPIQMGAP
jgi:hypothetical protein